MISSLTKEQYIGEFTLGSGIPSVKSGVNRVVGDCKRENGTQEVEIHQVLWCGENKYAVILNYYKESKTNFY
ncbi:hypothetical protein [Sporosarcina highlanderae]|uniref:Transposase n=1 Tax=Sporosarcina highlanderae TaxID=3035916 RepID=A0ABT8JSY7_9BACL|nr:hypothetical protein [Sporosarcina highlanderae]MDN4608194.1 hypothetical protein [Sporosarcina highlanderae]